MNTKIFLKFIIIFILIQSLFLAQTIYTDYVNLQVQFSNYQISDKAVTIILSEQENADIIDLKETFKSYNDISILSTVYKSSDLEVCGFIGKELFLRLIRDKDNASKYNLNNIAVIGQNIADSENCFIDKNQDMYFKFNNREYLVVEVISTDISNMLSNTAFVKFNDYDSLSNLKITVDGSTSDNIDSVVNCIKQEYLAYTVNENNNFIERTILNKDDIKFIGILVYIFMFILFAAIFVIIVLHYKKEVKVKCIIGFSFYRIFLNIEKYITLFIGVSTCIVVIVYSILYKFLLFNFFIKMNLYYLIMFTLALYLMLSVLIYIYYCVTTKIFLKNGVR